MASLIANTGIQFFTFTMEIDMNNNFKMFFHEWYDVEDEELKLEIAHCFEEDEIWVKKRDIFNLLGLGLTNGKVGRIENGSFIPYKWEEIKDDFFEEGYKTLTPMETDDGGTDCFAISMSNCHLDKFENHWLPFPFFTLGVNGKSEFAPTNWCRCMLVPRGDVENNIKKYNILLVFDTRTKYEDEGFEDEDLMETPVFSCNIDQEKKFAVCNNEFSLVDFCSKTKNCEWVDEYVLGLYHSTPDIKIKSLDQVNCRKPKMCYLAEYVFLMKYIQESNVLPVVTLYSNRNVVYGSVDLVVDIGNSRTCAVLFDNPNVRKLKDVEMLGLQNFTHPIKGGKLNCPANPFDMRLAFREAKFGVDTLRDSLQFVFPSMVRLGDEANELIHKAVDLNIGAEKITTFSSPKRYLWDNSPSEKNWEFVVLNGENDSNRLVRIKGVSEQLSSDGSLNPRGEGAIDKNYSRKALMTFCFLEILAQANMQINSYAYRHRWSEDGENKPRRLGRIIVTCPTAMSKVEQIALRKSAEDAAIILERFYEGESDIEIDEQQARKAVCVIPSARSLENGGERREWIYDEASCSQFVYLFSEINKRYNKNFIEYFDFYGKVREVSLMVDNQPVKSVRELKEVLETKKRDDIVYLAPLKQRIEDEDYDEYYDENTGEEDSEFDDLKQGREKTEAITFEYKGGGINEVLKNAKRYVKESLIVGSVDIGAGTTDVMIAEYKYDDSGQCTLTPIPLFWESFYIAGDDLLKNMVRDLIIEGDEALIKNQLKSIGGKDVVKTILKYFAPDNSTQTATDRKMRSEFNIQVSIPVVSKYLQLLNENAVDDKTFTFDEMFANNKPTKRVLKHFEKHFGFSIKDVQWHYDKNKVSDIIVKTFGDKDERSDNSLVGKISAILSYYDCDIVLLSGRPTSLKPLTELFLDHLPVLPNRLITLNDYRIGTWYPFQDGKGYFKEAKSIVAVGALIGNYASTSGSLEGFSLNLGELIKTMKPTTEYFAKTENGDAFISPILNTNTIVVSQLPMRIWTRQLDTFSYPTRPFYMLGYDKAWIKNRMMHVRGIAENDNKAAEEALNNEIQRIQGLEPFTFTIVRENYSQDKELLKIVKVEDRNGSDFPFTNYFSLSIQSMNEEEDYWLDSGAFVNLGINA